MKAAQIIARKRDGQELTTEQIESFVAGYTDGSIPDYQMSALAMAICINGMQPAEIAALTAAMLHSGVTIDWQNSDVAKVDKHSTGGIGDKVSLILAPLLACCGLQVPMISGRGLGATGGTLDKLESIPGFRTDLSLDEIRRLTEQIGCVITGATAELAPADRKLYALRDVTATIPSIPLITGSIMSKKLAEGLDALVLDVKFGSGAFMKSQTEARQLAESLVAVGTRMNVATTGLLTDMNQPLGRMIGNAVEVDESIDALEGGGPEDLRELTLALGAELLVSTGIQSSTAAATAQLAELLDSGHARQKFQEMVAAQGGDLDAPRRVATASEVLASRDGYVTTVDAERLGEVVIRLGGGRRVMSDSIDHAVGLEMLVRIGDVVQRGQPLMTVLADSDAAMEVRSDLIAAVTIDDGPLNAPQLIVDRFSAQDESEP